MHIYESSGASSFSLVTGSMGQLDQGIRVYNCHIRKERSHSAGNISKFSKSFQIELICSKVSRKNFIGGMRTPPACKVM